jgi:hypothetical protein
MGPGGIISISSSGGDTSCTPNSNTRCFQEDPSSFWPSVCLAMRFTLKCRRVTICLVVVVIAGPFPAAKGNVSVNESGKTDTESHLHFSLQMHQQHASNKHQH